MREPFLQDDAFLEDVQAARHKPNSFHLWWLGQSGFLLQWQDRHLLLDPYLSDSLTRKYAGTEKPHTRLTGRVIAPERLDFILGVTSTHNHTDHLDAETLIPLMQVNPDLRVVVPEANRAFAAERLQVDPATLIGLDDGASAEIGGFTLTGVPAAHEELDRDERGHFQYLGFLVEFGSFCIYHSGDTVMYPGMAARLKESHIDVALLPINGRAPERGVPGNLDGQEAAALAKDIKAGVVIPCHYDMFSFNTASPEPFARACKDLHQPYSILRNGERWSSLV